MLRKYEFTEEGQASATKEEWKAKMELKSSLGWYRIAKEDFGLESYITSLRSYQESIEDKNRHSRIVCR